MPGTPLNTTEPDVNDNRTSTAETCPSIPAETFYLGSAKGSQSKRSFKSSQIQPTASSNLANKLIKKAKKNPARGKILQVLEGEEENVQLSKAGQRAMSTVSPYLQAFTQQLEKFYKGCGTSGQSLVMEKLAEIQEVQSDMNQRLATMESKLETILVTVKAQSTRSANTLSAGLKGDIDEGHNQSREGKGGHPGILGGQLSLDDISPHCGQLAVKAFLGLIPPIDVEMLSLDQLNMIREHSTSEVNFAVNLYRLSTTPYERMKMSTSGYSKGPFRQNKEKIPEALIGSILGITQSIFGGLIKDKALRSAIDGECRQIFYRAKQCRQQQGCAICQQGDLGHAVEGTPGVGMELTVESHSKSSTFPCIFSSHDHTYALSRGPRIERTPLHVSSLASHSFSLRSPLSSTLNENYDYTEFDS